MFEHCEGKQRRRRTPEHGYTISTLFEAEGSGELKSLSLARRWGFEIALDFH